MSKKSLPIMTISVVLFLLKTTIPVHATPDHIKSFFGNYTGSGAEVVGEGLSERDLNLVVKPFKEDGFTLIWTSVLRKKDGRLKKRSHLINFRPVLNRKGIYTAEMRRTPSGLPAPLDPINGDPYVWAGVQDKLLVVHTFYITDDGGYEIHVYTRKLTQDGMSLHWERVRDGKKLKLITAKLQKVGK